jgi:serine/threonine protein kinase
VGTVGSIRLGEHTMSNVNMLEDLAHPEFFETIDQYRPQEEDFKQLVAAMLGDDWSFQRNGVWLGAHPPKDRAPRLPAQGWKIHMSCSLSQSADMLKTVVPILKESYTEFKFSMDRRILMYMNAKKWVRQGAGKFLTIYPYDTDDFRRLIERLYQSTAAFHGPYILSDRRYKDSRVLFYRYGGILPPSQLEATGELTSLLVSPSGEQTTDRRVPYFIMPAWTEDPFGIPVASPEAAAPSTVSLKDGRYIVNSVLRYSNSGGIYTATDTTTGETVVIKEARPYVETSEDATDLLRKEYRLLSAIADLRIAPRPIDLFQDWEHMFLVEEFIPGQPLSKFAVRYNVAIHPEPTIDDTALFYSHFRTVFLQLAEILRTLHERRIVFADLSPTNLIVDPQTLKLTILDFEAAHEMDVDAPVRIVTEGFAFIDQTLGQKSTFESDRFALGAVMHFFIWPINGMWNINPRSRHTVIAHVLHDIGFPESIRELIAALLDKDAHRRPSLPDVIAVLQREEPVHAPWSRPQPPEPLPDITARYRRDVQDIVRFVLSTVSPNRQDRLFPADGALFRTNPLSVAHGACGVAFAIHRTTGEVPAAVVDWILANRRGYEKCPPGLYLGLAGVAWTLLELGIEDKAKQAMAAVYQHRLLYDSPDLYFGAAGWGMASLRFFAHTGDAQYLQRATEAGLHLIRTERQLAQGSHWSANEAEIPLGLGYGASGIALFLLYLFLTTGDERFLDTGRRGLAYDSSKGVDRGRARSWPRFADRNAVVYPYWRIGAAGIGMVVLRYHRLLGEAQYQDTVDRIVHDVDGKYSVMPGFAKGLAGKGEFLLDAYMMTGDASYLEAAHDIACGISMFKIEKPDGLAFPGDTLRRLSCDYMTGSAGIAHFLHRLTHLHVPSAFMLDELFDRTSQAEAIAGRSAAR